MNGQKERILNLTNVTVINGLRRFEELFLPKAQLKFHLCFYFLIVVGVSDKENKLEIK